MLPLSIKQQKTMKKSMKVQKQTQEIQEKYTPRIASRIFGEYKPLLFAGTDVRRQKLTKKK